MSNTKNLFSDFNAVSRDDWMKVVEKDLKGKPIDDVFWHLNEQTKIAPFYHKEDNITTRKTLSNNTNNDWLIGEDIVVDDLKANNKTALTALMGGAQSLRFKINHTITKGKLDTLFKDIELEYITTQLQFGDRVDVMELLYYFSVFLSKRNKPIASLNGGINAGILDAKELKQVLDFANDELPNFIPITIDLTDAEQGVEKVVDELVDGLTRGRNIIESLASEGKTLQSIPSKIQFSIAIGKSYFVEIAKIRALKILWANLLKAYGLDHTTPVVIDAYLSPRTWSEDQYQNMIAATTQAMSAVLGGVDRLTVLPANTLVESPNGFTRRIARNVQHLLKMETYLDRVVDPAAGSYYIEKLTNTFAEQAWG